jgi:ABC-2 type transport system ATP-binding protein
VGDPELIFLDEPTTGFDPAARRAAWDVVRALRSLGKTVLLTTTTSTRRKRLPTVAIIKDGRILGRGSAGRTGGRAPRYHVSYRDASGRVQEHDTDDPTAFCTR